MQSIKGQILPDSAFGKKLTELAMQSEILVEVGTWYGLGSTKCLANGLIRPSQRMWTVEADHAICDEAKSYYDDPRITFLKGCVLDVIDQIPDKIDLILFDGSDDSTNLEFAMLSGRCSIVALDDTMQMKNRRQRQLILTNHEQWEILADEPKDRLGWMIAKKRFTVENQ